MLIGYARVSTRRQKLHLQIQALEDAGCDLIIAEKLNGKAPNKRGLAAAIALCEAGDELLTWKLDRFGRDLGQLVDLMRTLHARRVRPRILTGQAAAIDLDTPEGRALYGVFASFADLEHVFGRTRASAGMAAARVRKAGRNRRTLTAKISAQCRYLRYAFNRQATCLQ